MEVELDVRASATYIDRKKKEKKYETKFISLEFRSRATYAAADEAAAAVAAGMLGRSVLLPLLFFPFVWVS